MTALLEVRDLRIAFSTGEATVDAVRGVSFSLAAGKTLALVGESGSGKSVTAASVLRLLPPSAKVAGEILLEGTDLATASDRQLRGIRGSRVGMIFQEPMTSLNPLHTVERQIGEVLRTHRGLGRAAARERTLELLRQVEISEPESRLQSYPHQLSGGQRQRVMIAMALACDPVLLIADEPTTALDVTVEAQILTLLQSLQRQRGMAMLFITHDLGIVRDIADDVAVMTNGEIVEAGPTAAVFSNPQHAYTRKLLDAQPRGEPPTADPAAPVVIEADGLSVSFGLGRRLFGGPRTTLKAVDDVSLRVRQGHTVGIVGESGSGKSTLGRALLRLVSSKGRIVFMGSDLQARSWKAMRPLRKDMQIVFQDPFGSLSPRLSLGDIVAEGLEVHMPEISAAERRQRAVDALREVGLDPLSIDRYPHEFSGGQRQRIAIARAMVLEPRLVVLDEPTSALDMSVQAQVVDLLRELQRRHGLTYIFISHDLRVVRALANDVLVMQGGRIVEQGPAQTIFEAPRTAYTQALMAAAMHRAA